MDVGLVSAIVHLSLSGQRLKVKDGDIFHCELGKQACSNLESILLMLSKRTSPAS